MLCSRRKSPNAHGGRSASPCSLKFLYTSGYSPNGTKEGESLLEGINFLQKPYGPRKLLEAVRERLDGTPRSN